VGCVDLQVGKKYSFNTLYLSLISTSEDEVGC
jgi:hypothetical protein